MSEMSCHFGKAAKLLLWRVPVDAALRVHRKSEGEPFVSVHAINMSMLMRGSTPLTSERKSYTSENLIQNPKCCSGEPSLEAAARKPEG